jgi:hypothetical protein
MQVWMMPYDPVFDSESVSSLFRGFGISLFEIWERCISIRNYIHDREYDFRDFLMMKKCLIYLGSSTDICFFDISRREVSIEFGHRVYYCESGKCIISSGKHDILTTRKYATDRLKCLTSHDDGMSECRRLKVSKILTIVPRNFSCVSDDTIFRHSSDSDVGESHRKSIFFSREKAKNTIYHSPPLSTPS